MRKNFGCSQDGNDIEKKNVIDQTANLNTETGIRSSYCMKDIVI
jgi:hypothetical protein